MDANFKQIVGPQFGAAIDMLENAIIACPDDLWNDRQRKPELWYLVYHALFWLDLYSYGAVDGFQPPTPFTLSELDASGVLPARPYTKEEMRTYLEHGRQKCRSSIGALTEETARERCRFEWLDVSRAELFLYNMRHVQHHAAQLNLILRQVTDSAPSWVPRHESNG